MQITTHWAIIVEAEDDDRDDAFVEVRDEGIPEADEVGIRAGRGAFKFASADNARLHIWTREGLRLLHEAVGAYLAAHMEREDD